MSDIIRNEMQGYGTPPVIRRADLSHLSQLRCPPLKDEQVHRGQRRDGMEIIELKDELNQMRMCPSGINLEKRIRKTEENRIRNQGIAMFHDETVAICYSVYCSLITRYF
ncbi:MAG: hypothetical protein EZS28_028680 [Streblomastix strix]|uniref:Uncharacterized protein n=1 Tax=Streblomastix strix TaxID=222440 RepID=A0A5J4UZX9_9EUKA|nr:MAG: hypothetical protein EZS28_028680 [Streblomastix strix]